MEPERKHLLARILEAATGIIAVVTIGILSSVAGMNAYLAYQPGALEAQAAASQLTQGMSSEVFCPGESAAECALAGSTVGQNVTLVYDSGIASGASTTPQPISSAGDIGLLANLLRVNRQAPTAGSNAPASTSIGQLQPVGMQLSFTTLSNATATFNHPALQATSTAGALKMHVSSTTQTQISEAVTPASTTASTKLQIIATLNTSPSMSAPTTSAIVTPRTPTYASSSALIPSSESQQSGIEQMLTAVRGGIAGFLAKLRALLVL